MLLSGISGSTDFCDWEVVDLEEFLGVLFPSLVCSFFSWGEPSINPSKLAVVFDCVGSRYLVVEFNNI